MLSLQRFWPWLLPALCMPVFALLPKASPSISAHYPTRSGYWMLADGLLIVAIAVLLVTTLRLLFLKLRSAPITERLPGLILCSTAWIFSYALTSLFTANPLTGIAPAMEAASLRALESARQLTEQSWPDSACPALSNWSRPEPHPGTVFIQYSHAGLGDIRFPLQYHCLASGKFAVLLRYSIDSAVKIRGNQRGELHLDLEHFLEQRSLRIEADADLQRLAKLAVDY